MPYTPKWYDYTPLPFYPHMGPHDAALWNRFILQNPGLFKRCIYDMRCGTVTTLLPGTPKNIADAWQDLCRKRIDAVAESENSIFTIECRPRADWDAVANATGYKMLFELDHEVKKPVIALVITDFILPNTQMKADRDNCLIWAPETFNQRS